MAVVSSPKPDHLFTYLEDRGIRQRWLANRLGCSEQYLTHIKVGRKPVPTWLPERASEALGIPVSILFPDFQESASDE